MDDIVNNEKGNIFLTCTINEQHTWENICPQHIIAYIYSGELEATYGSNTITFHAGDTLLVPKHQLSRSVKKPKNGQAFQCVSILLPENELHDFYSDRLLLDSWSVDMLKQRPVKPHVLLTSFFESLHSYFEVQDQLPSEIITIKIREILTIIDQVDQRASAILGSFKEPGKIDLKAYMEEHFMYNIPLNQFASLTGRSLTTFKTDFKKLFNNTPGKWLTEKRLQYAHYMLTVEHVKISEVYHSAGFENLSHFSYAFKKAFGYAPSSLQHKK